MKKIPSLFVRDYEGGRTVIPELVEAASWVMTEPEKCVPTRKWDGTSCLVRDGQLWRRYDRKKDRKTGEHKEAPPGWEAAELEPNEHTGHWPGWLPVGNGKEDLWYRMAWANALVTQIPDDGTYELVGPHFNNNPETLTADVFIRHGVHLFTSWWDQMIESLQIEGPDDIEDALPTFFINVKQFLEICPMEGLVWHHEDGRMCKIKRRDFSWG